MPKGERARQRVTSAAAPKAKPEKLSPKDVLYSLQRRFIDDGAQYKIGVMTRQWGKSTVTSGEAVRDCVTDPGTTWVCMSAGERQSVEWLNKAREWQQAYRAAVTDVAEDRGGLAEGLLRSAEIRFRNGSRIIAIPANPNTARGYSANIILDEFAYHENPGAIWAAMFPSTTNELAGTFNERWRAMVTGEAANPRRRLKLRVVSTFNGRNNKFFELWERAGENGYSAHKVTVHDAVADGMPLDAEKLRLALDDATAWAQEYECEPADDSAVLLPYELMAPCENALAGEAAPEEFWHGSPNANAPLFLGIDFGRKRDLTVCWAIELAGNEFRQTKEVFTLANAPTQAQLEALRPRIRKAHSVCFDYTGPGVGLGDLLAGEFGEWNPEKHSYGKIELCHFTNQLKVDIFPKLRMAFDQKTIGVPVSRAIREDLHSMSRVALAGGGVTYRAPHTADGHADRCTALALALRAATHLGNEIGIIVFENSPQYRALVAREERSLLG